MATHVLTPNSPNPVTGLVDPVDGWHLTAATALDVLQGMAVIGALGYGHRLESVDITVSPPIYQLVMQRDNETVTVADTDWFVSDGRAAWCITEADVTANYTVTAG